MEELTANVAPSPDKKPETTPRYRVMVGIHRESTDSTFWQRLGTAFVNYLKDGTPFIKVKLDAHPIGNEMDLFPDDGRERAGSETAHASAPKAVATSGAAD
jgi:hypothetical protein